MAKKSVDSPNKMPMGGHNNQVVAKPKDFKKSMGKLIRYLKPFKVVIIISLIFACFGTAFSIVGPKILEKMGTIIENWAKPEVARRIEGKGVAGVSIDFTKILNIGLILISLYVVSAILNFLQHYLLSGVAARSTKKFRRDIAGKIDKLPLKYFDSTSTGDILSRITNDVDTVGQTLNQTLASIISSITLVIGSIIMMFTISWELTLISLVTIPMSFLLIGLIIKFSQKHFKKQQRMLGLINGHIEETFSNHNVVKVFNGEARARAQFDKYNDELYNSGYKSQFLSGLMMPITFFVSNIAYVAICVIGGVLSTKGALSIAAIIAFIMYIRQINHPIGQLATALGTLQSAAAASERIFQFLESDEQCDEVPNPKTIENFNGRVEFKNVNFGYEPDKQIIYNFSCDVKPGQKIAIVGPTGAGKTTLVNLLMRFYEISDGDILIDGVSIKMMTRSYVRSLFGMVLQDTWLFEGSIKENLAFGNPDATNDDIVKACEILGVDHFIRTLSGGYDMLLNEEAALSQGQKQILTIARTMVQNSPMLILDEATSSVDTRTEVLIQQAMDTLMKNRTTFVIAHRLSTIKNADIILVMKDGNVIEKGNHGELMSKADGFYKELYNSQFSKQNAEIIEI